MKGGVAAAICALGTLEAAGYEPAATSFSSSWRTRSGAERSVPGS